MDLHLNREAFEDIITDISQKTGIRNDIIEKDYYLTLLLWELSQKQDSLPAYFKGGTALYKAIGEFKRFSEDIDLTVEAHDCSKSQGKKRLELAANGYSQLCRTTEKERESNQRGSITSVYEYKPITAIDDDDALQRFGYVKVEATSFTISEPTEPMEVAPLLYSEATTEQKLILENTFDVRPFMIQTITMERIFADKILAAEFYYQRDMLFDTAKHLYDLATMMEQGRIKQLLNTPDELVRMLSYKRKEEAVRIGSDLSEKPFSEFQLFYAVEQDEELGEAFKKMQEIYVFDKKDILPMDVLIDGIYQLSEILLTLDEGLDIEAEQDPFMQQRM